MKIIKHKSLPLKIPEFICDHQLNPKMNEYPMLSHMNAYTYDCYIGKPGSGKTSLMIAFLSDKNIYKKIFHNVLVVMPSSSIQSMKKIFSKSIMKIRCIMN